MYSTTFFEIPPVLRQSAKRDFIYCMKFLFCLTVMFITIVWMTELSKNLCETKRCEFWLPIVISTSSMAFVVYSYLFCKYCRVRFHWNNEPELPF
jgi:hypothetical protein